MLELRKFRVECPLKSGSVIEAALRLQIGKTTLYRLMDVFGIKKHSYSHEAEKPEATDLGLPPEQNYLFEDE